MQWRHQRRKRALALAAVNILLPDTNREVSQLLTHQQQPGVYVNIIQTLASLLRRCSNREHLQQGRHIHSQILAAGLTGNMFLGNMLIQMYGRCGSLVDARAVFDGFLWERTLPAWNSLMTAFAQNGQTSVVVKLYREMCEADVEPNMLTYVRVLAACSSLRALADGRAIHSKVISSGYDTQVGINTTLVDMYGKCGCLEDSRRVFDRMECRTVTTWNAIISCYAQNGHADDAVGMYRRMNCEGVMADVFTFSIVSGVCDLRDGEKIHERAIADGLETQLILGTALVKMYGRCGSVELAVSTFEKVQNKDIVCWTALIAAFVGRGFHIEAFRAYRDALALHLEPDTFTFSTVLCACTGPETLEVGREIHELVIVKEYETDVIVGTALVNMYGKCKQVDEAKLAFDRIRMKNVVSWNAMFGALAESGMDLELVELYKKMDLEPDVLVFSKLLASCSNLGDLQTGENVHRRLELMGLDSEPTLENGLVSMYSSCGSYHKAKRSFDKALKRDPVCWNAMISATSRYGQTELVLELGTEMELNGIEPNEITLTGVLHACAHAGLVDAAGEYFRTYVSSGRRLVLVPEHFHCLLDLFGRLGMLCEAEELIYTMPFVPDVVAWTTLVGACKVHLDSECAARCLGHVNALEPRISGPYVLLSNLYLE